MEFIYGIFGLVVSDFGFQIGKNVLLSCLINKTHQWSPDLLNLDDGSMKVLLIIPSYEKEIATFL